VLSVRLKVVSVGKLEQRRAAESIFEKEAIDVSPIRVIDNSLAFQLIVHPFSNAKCPRVPVEETKSCLCCFVLCFPVIKAV